MLMADPQPPPRSDKYIIYKKPINDKYFEPESLAAALSKVKVGEPETFQGFYKKDAKLGRMSEPYDEYVTSSPPDVGPKTRVIAVCGIQNSQAGPNEHGWFLADFAVFWHLLNGLGMKQRWLHCLQMDVMLKNHGAYLHGNPFGTRKVVLNKEIFEEISKSKTPWEFFESDELLKKTIKAIQDEFESIEKDGGNLLLVFLGHGHLATKSVVLGQKDLLKTRLIELLKTDKGHANVTVLTTACYSGTWSCDPNFNPSDPNLRSSTMTAATEGLASRSWVYSSSTGRACGSMFTTAVKDMLIRDSQSGDLLDKNLGEDTREQQKTYSEFCRTLYEHLFDIDRRGYVHMFTFSAKEDLWGQGWRERSGLPLADYKERWESLVDYPADPKLHPGDPRNQDPKVSQEVRDEWEELYAEADALGKVQKHPEASKGSTSAAGGMAGEKRKRSAIELGGKANETQEAFKWRVIGLASQYLDSYPGDDEQAANGGSGQHRMRMLVEDRPGASKFTIESIAGLLPIIEYRMKLMSFADAFVEKFELKSPDGKSCSEFDMEALESEDYFGKIMNKVRLIFDHQRNLLLPLPYEEKQGLEFLKPFRYLALAFLNSGYSDEKIKRMVKEEADLVERDMKEMGWDGFRSNRDLWAKRRNVFESFGRADGNVSPIKRNLSPSKNKRASLQGAFDPPTSQEIERRGRSSTVGGRAMGGPLDLTRPIAGPSSAAGPPSKSTPAKGTPSSSKATSSKVARSQDTPTKTENRKK